MITTICLNPSFDRTVEMNSLKVGDVNRVRALREDMGGKGINVAVVARRLGLDVQCLGVMGAEDGDRLSAMMDREGLTGSLALVSNNFHLYRAGLIARSQGLVAKTVCARSNWYSLLTFTVREAVGVVYFWLFQR